MKAVARGMKKNEMAGRMAIGKATVAEESRYNLVASLSMHRCTTCGGRAVDLNCTVDADERSD